MSCECLPTCPFFHDRMKNMPTTAEVLKQQYCMGDWSLCARCTIYRELGTEAIPSDLFPHEMARARAVLQAHGASERPPSRDHDR